MAAGRIIAVVDVGSNSVRLLVARELSPTAFEVVDEERFDARLGEGQSASGLTPEGVERGLRALRIVTQVAAAHSPDELIAVGTEALRRAANADAFIEEARRQTGVRVRVLSGYEEAFAGYVGTINSTVLCDGYLLDIGGGSLELMRVQGRALAHVQSVPFGAIYAKERFFRGDPPAPRDVRALRKAVRKELQTEKSAGTVFASGGAVRNLARLIKARRRDPLRRLHGYVVTRRDFHRLANDLVRLDADARRRMPGMGTGRLDTLPAAATVIDEILALTGASELTVAGQGLREGLVWQVIRGWGAVLPDVRGASVAGLALANGVSEMANAHVVDTADRLFEATSPVHGYGPWEHELLLAAARLSGIGLHVDYYNRERHAEYLVHSGDLHGFSHREIVVIAALVRHVLSGTPDLSPYRTVVQPEDERRALVLAVLLGAARATWRRSLSPVHRVECTLESGALRITLHGPNGLDAEIYELERQQRRLETALKVRVEVTSAS